ncbi:hypothetical protein [Scytonema sp. PCC 10023]|uniref:hypothetical protein n=1 Tax=Scytonema sp. PCC 10023 TaxID=1680591 RepID=UPI0039C6C3B4
MTENDFQGLVAHCQALDTQRKAQLIYLLLGEDRSIKVIINEPIFSTNSIPKFLNTIADFLVDTSGGGRLRLELHREA